MSQSWSTTLNYILTLFLTQSDTPNSVSWTSKLNIFFTNSLMITSSCGISTNFACVWQHPANGHWVNSKGCDGISSDVWEVLHSTALATSKSQRLLFLLQTVLNNSYTHIEIHTNAHTNRHTNKHWHLKVPPDPTLKQRNHPNTDPAIISQSQNSAHSY